MQMPVSIPDFLSPNRSLRMAVAVFASFLARSFPLMGVFFGIDTILSTVFS